MEAGRQLLLSADSRAEAALQDELLNIQERWRHANICLEEQKKELAVLLRVKLFMALQHLLTSFAVIIVWIILVFFSFKKDSSKILLILVIHGTIVENLKISPVISKSGNKILKNTFL